MPVEIYQLNINVNVKDDKNADTGQGSGGSEGGSVDKKMIVDTCVEKVLEIINQKEMR